MGACLEDAVLAFSCCRKKAQGQDVWTAEWLTEDLPALEIFESRLAGIGVEKPFFKIEMVPQIDWLEQCYRQFPPFAVGPFYIYGSHCTPAPPEGSIPLEIDAATAFGSGEHGTTAGCLEALYRLKADGFSPARILDMGTGSGILAIAAAKLWDAPVLAADNDPESVRVADRHRTINKVPDGTQGMTCLLSEGFASETVRSKGPYNLVIANILAGPLIEMAADLTGALAPGGVVVLSGLLDEQIPQVRAAYENEKLAYEDATLRGEWATLILRKAA